MTYAKHRNNCHGDRYSASQFFRQAVAEAPGQVIDVRAGRVVAQSIRRVAPGDRVYLLRVVIDLWPDGPEVVTTYLTSRIAKYSKGAQ